MIRLLALLCLALCSCGEPRLLNPGAPLSVTAVSGHDIAQASGGQSRAGFLLEGLYTHGNPGHILLQDHAASDHALAHELAHYRDMNGGTYAHAIEMATPPNPTPEMKRKLAICWEIEAKGEPWQALKDRFGASAVGHPEILARLK